MFWAFLFLLVVVFGVIAANKRDKKKAKFDEFCDLNGLKIFFKPAVVSGGEIGLDRDKKVMVWMASANDTPRIFSADEIRGLEGYSTTNLLMNREVVSNKVAIKTHDLNNPRFELSFGNNRAAAEDFVDRCEILFNLK